jgi:hypothetical protein
MAHGYRLLRPDLVRCRRGVPMTPREIVARIVDPSSWRVHDAELERVKRHHPHGGYDPDNFKDQRSLTRADEILAALSYAGMVEALGHENACRLSILFNRSTDLRTTQDRDINEWLKGLIAAAAQALKDAQP